MTHDIPLWMDKNFFTKILEEDLQKVQVTRFDTKPAVGPGYNYTSTIFRVQVSYLVENCQDEKTVSLIVKVPISQGIISELDKKMGFFGKEPVTYQELLPFIFKKIKHNLGPKGYISPVKNVIVMEDLKEEGFVVCKSLKQLDYQHCEKVMEAIAKFHACTVICSKENPKLIETLGEVTLWVKGTIVETWMKIGTEIVLDIAKEINGDTKFINFLSSRLDHVYDGIVQSNKPNQNGLNVLNHGDLWSSNVMFKHDNSGKVLDVKFVDFQITRWASPVVDLVYFIWTSASEDVRKNKLTDLFRVYLSTLNSTLEQFECPDRLSWEELREGLASSKDWALVMICLCLPVLTSAAEDVLDFGNFSEKDFESEKFRSIYRSENYLSILPEVLKSYSDFFLSE